MEAIAIGETIGNKYQILAKLGVGGMGAVYQARDTTLDRIVAIKALHVEREADAKGRERFVREARSLAKLAHANVLPIYELLEQGDTYYMVMQYVSGGTVKDQIRSAWWTASGEGLSPEFVVQVIVQTARALDYAHNLGIIHRDIKPGNILLSEDGQVLLADFGIAKWTEVTQDAGLTAEGGTIGTPAYMSPEQINNRDLCPQSDVYALAIVAYEMLVGECPFKGETISIIHQQLNVPPPPILERNPDIPDEVQDVLFKALEKVPENRYARAGEFASALQNAFTSLTGEITVDAVPLGDRMRQSAAWGAITRRKRRKKTAQEASFLERAGRAILRLVVTLVIVVVLVGGLILTALSLVLARLAENQIARADWELYQTYEVTHTESELSQGVTKGIDKILAGFFESAEVDFKAPEDIYLNLELQSGKTLSVYGTVKLNEDGEPVAALRRINKVPLTVFGAIIAGGINRGFDRALQEEQAEIRDIEITNNSIILSVYTEQDQ